MYSWIFDPVGFLSPFILGPKLLSQELSCIKLDWDDPVPKCMDTMWQKWFSNIGKISTLKFDRCIIPHEGFNSLEFHTFADMSTEAYTLVCFLCIVYQNEILVKYLFGKSRVQPMNCDWTVPHMELIATSLAA